MTRTGIGPEGKLRLVTILRFVLSIVFLIAAFDRIRNTAILAAIILIALAALFMPRLNVGRLVQR